MRGGAAPTYGDLTVDNGTVAGQRGGRSCRRWARACAGTGSGGATLATGRSKAIPAYFVGHWVEVRNAAGVLEGTWRIASIGRRRLRR